MIFGAGTAQIAAEFADVLPGNLTAKAAFLERGLLARLPEAENCVTVTCLSDRGLLVVSGQWHHLEKTHDILRSWIAEHRSEGELVDAAPTSAILPAELLLPSASRSHSDNVNANGSTFGQNVSANGNDELTIACKSPNMVNSEQTPTTKLGEVLTAQPEEIVTSQRKRGRPRKQVTADKIVESPRNRGRPQKRAAVMEIVESPRKRGRPRKQVTQEQKVAVATNVVAEIRRSKRTIKPRSFSPIPVKKATCNTAIPRHNCNKTKGDNTKSKETVIDIGADSDTRRRNVMIHSIHDETNEKSHGKRSTRNTVVNEDVPPSVTGIVQLQCDDCGYHTMSARNLKRHRMSREGLKKDLLEHKRWHKKQFSCGHCHKKMAKAYLLDRHMSQQHPEIKDHIQTDRTSSEISRTSATDRQYQQLPDNELDQKDKVDSQMTDTDDMDICKGSSDVNGKNNLEEDENWFDEYPVKCTLCKHQTTSQLNLRYHVQRMHMERKHECQVCYKKFGLKKDLNEHQRWHSKTHECNLCSKKFATVYLLNGHLAKTHGTEVKVEDKEAPANKPRLPLYGCTQCTYITKFPRNFRNHLYRHHVEKKLKCPVCSKMFALPKDLKQHMVFHTVQIFTCEVCGKKLKSKFALKVHTNVLHKGIKITPKAYLCTLCGKLCRNITAYKEHQNREHLHVKPFLCDICGAAFHGKATLKMHKLKHTSERNFPCQVCGKAFKGQPSLNTHMLIHKQVRPFECETCKKGFTQKAALTRHCRIHTGERPYQCKLCRSTFNDNSILRRHMIGIHKIPNGKLGENVSCFEWVVDLEKPELSTSSEMVIEIESYPERCSLSNKPRVVLVKTEEAGGSTEAKPELSGTTVSETHQQHVTGQCTDVQMPPALQFSPEHTSRTSPSIITCQSVADAGVVGIGNALNSKEDPSTPNWELCSVTNPSHMGVTISNIVAGSSTPVSMWNRPTEGEYTSDVVTVVEEKNSFAAWDSQVVPSASNERVVYAPLSLESDGVYILVSDSVMPTAGETAVTMQDSSDCAGQQ